MSLTDEILATERDLYLQVRLKDGIVIQPSDPTSSAGVPGVAGLQISKSFSAPVPVASLTVNRIPDWVIRGMEVKIDLGYNGLFKRVFTGSVQDRSHGIGTSIVNCAGKLYKLFRSIEIPSRDVDGLNVKTAIEAILDDVDIPASDRDTDDIPTGFTLGSASDATLERQLSSQMAQTLMDIEGVRVYEDGNGLAQFKVIDFAPAGVAFRKYSTITTAIARILGGGVREDPSFTRTRVTVRGATVVEGSDPNETSRTIEQTATVVSGALIRPPLLSGQFIDAEYANHLIDTDAKALSVAERLLTEFARVPKSLTLEIPGDPELELGMTMHLEFDELAADGLWFIYGLTHMIDSQGFRTIVDLRGGEDFGVTIGINPIASFDYRIDRQVIDDRVWATVTFDATASYDPDSETALTYAWSDDQTTTPEISTLTTAVVTVRIDPAAITPPWTVTLTVTDADGLTATMVRVIDVEATGSLVTVPAIFAAIDNRFSATPDGGEAWNDQTDGGVISVAARPRDGVNFGHAVFGTSDGEIWRTKDFIRSAATQEIAIGGTPRVEWLAWDWRDPTRVWALTDEATLFLSTDGGDSFSEYDDLRDVLGLASAIGKHIGLPGPGGVWVYGGDGAGNPLIAYDAVVGNHDWQQITFGGELASDLPATSASLAIVMASDKGDGSGLAIIMENADSGVAFVRPIYHTTSPFTPANWQRATGLAAGDVDGRYIVGAPGFTDHFIAAFNDRDIWKSANGVAWTETATVMPANVVPHHAIWVRAFVHSFTAASFYLIAAENTSDASAGIYKSIDEMQSVQVLRPATGFDAWPASAIGRQVAVGPSLGQEARLAVVGLLGSPTERSISYKASALGFTAHVFTTNFDLLDFFNLRCLTANLWFVIFHDFDQDWADGAAARTEDGGTTWDDTYAVPDTGRVWMDIRRASDGRLWGVTVDSADLDHMEIWYSDDDGDSWTESKDDVPADTSRMWKIITHPTDPNRIAAFGGDGGSQEDPRLWFTTTRGTTWNQNDVANLLSAGHMRHDVIQLQSNRFVMTGWLNGTANFAVWTSDDNGAAWTLAQDFGLTGAQGLVLGPVGEPTGTRLYVLVVDKTGSPWKNEIWESPDGGLTWADIANDAPIPAAADDHNGGIAYDPIEKALYVYGAASANTTNEKHIMKLSPIDATTEWQDMSDTLVPISGHASYSVLDDTTTGIAVIPEV